MKSALGLLCIFLLYRGNHCNQLVVCLSRDIQLENQKIFLCSFCFVQMIHYYTLYFVYLLNLFHITMLFGDYLLIGLYISNIFNIYNKQRYSEIECITINNFNKINVILISTNEDLLNLIIYKIVYL